MDIQMPEIDSIQATRRITQEKIHTVVVGLSAGG